MYLLIHSIAREEDVIHEWMGRQEGLNPLAAEELLRSMSRYRVLETMFEDWRVTVNELRPFGRGNRGVQNGGYGVQDMVRGDCNGGRGESQGQGKVMMVAGGENKCDILSVADMATMGSEGQVGMLSRDGEIRVE